MKEVWTLKQHIDLLKQKFPLYKPVRVTVRHLKTLGSVAVTEKAVYISIEKDIKLSEQKETLWHEWAHAVAGWDEKREHNDKWGIIYASIYRVMNDAI